MATYSAGPVWVPKAHRKYVLFNLEEMRACGAVGVLKWNFLFLLAHSSSFSVGRQGLVAGMAKSTLIIRGYPTGVV